ncbi:coniferin beta-glucosidase-like [Cryptomeria japonica]|uniref:coniferin beta-glucosidase-like n=1 Tax=Cryptomeria japonica TaxID=3369 RepID=UPI0027DA88F8|nr:coniferin beta-glucosidase-like [Cryptomeria japonica]
MFTDGKGKINQARIEYYSSFINALLRNVVQPFITLFHFDLPNALQDSYGGWISPEIVLDLDSKATNDSKIVRNMWQRHVQKHEEVLQMLDQAIFVDPKNPLPTYQKANV